MSLKHHSRLFPGHTLRLMDDHCNRGDPCYNQMPPEQLAA